MQKKLLINNIAIGFVVLCIWLWEYHWHTRLRHKVSPSSITLYRNIGSELKNENQKDRTSEFCTSFHFNSQDTLYLTFVNFQTLDEHLVDQQVQAFKHAHSSLFSGIHKLKIYVKSIKIQVSNIVGLIDRVRHEFAGIHAQRQNMYEVYILNDYFDEQLIHRGDQLFVKTSKRKLLEQQFIDDLARRSLYHLKNIRQIYDSSLPAQATFKEFYHQQICNCLKLSLALYIDSIEYVNSNRNLVFFDKYLNEIEREATIIASLISNKDIHALERLLLKNEYFIYTTVYMYEDY